MVNPPPIATSAGASASGDLQGRGRRILLLSLELNYAPFSGNGVLARSLVSSLARRGDCSVRVICARPHPSAPAASEDICMAPGGSGDGGGSLEIWPVELPEGCQWKRLDRSGPWREYAEGGGASFAARVNEFRPTDVVAVDWHGMLAWSAIRHSILHHDGCVIATSDADAPSAWQPCDATVCYYNFRVYSSSSWDNPSHQPNNGGGRANEEESESDDEFYRRNERVSCRMANVIVCLSDHDKCMLRRLVEEEVAGSCSPRLSTSRSSSGLTSDDEPILSEEKAKHIHILHPPLRGDIWELASSSTDESCYNHYLPPEAERAIEALQLISPDKQRLFLTCMVRLSPEKSPHHFVQLLQRLGGVEFLRRNALIPVMCGARSVDGYATKVLGDFHALLSAHEGYDGEDPWPFVVIERHLGPNELAGLFSRTAVNVHPCFYDAYGMTLVESAAFGAVSIVNNGGKVGATMLLGEGKGCIAVDLEKLESNADGDGTLRLIESLRSLLDPKSDKHVATLGQIAKEAKSQALEWDEMACCQGLIDILNESL